MEEIRVVAYTRISSKGQIEKEMSIPAKLKAICKYFREGKIKRSQGGSS